MTQPPGLEPGPAEPDAALLQAASRLPKVVLHDHLDGSLREATLLTLLLRQGIEPPAETVEGLKAWFDARAHAGSLDEYLKGFALTVAAMASPQALRRVAFEAAEDARLDGCVLAEFRIAPLLFEPFGLQVDAVVEALLDGLAGSPLRTGLIVCAMRNHGPDIVKRSAELALRWQGRGVVGFDLAGAEAGWPATAHGELLKTITGSGLGLTLHAGEADGAQRVLEAVHLGATRIGHGVRLTELIGTPAWPAVSDLLHARSVHLEVCPTSNVHTGAAASIATHPIRALWAAGVSLSFHTDNRLMSRTSASREAALLLTQAGFTMDALLAMGRAAAQASFLEPLARQEALRALDPGAAAAS